MSFCLQDQLRGKWGFQGYVVSDCGAVRNILDGHHYEPTQAQASAISLERGMDNECIDFRAKVTDDHDYKPYIDAVKEGYLKESEIDTALVRLFTARMKLGMFDPPEMVPYSKIDESELNSAAHRALALKLANESMVLLKNDGVLPLKNDRGQDSWWWARWRSRRACCWAITTGFRRIRFRFWKGCGKSSRATTMNFVQGTEFLSKETQPVPDALLTYRREAGREGDLSEGEHLNAGEHEMALRRRWLATRIEPGIDVCGPTAARRSSGDRAVSIRWETTLTPKESGDYNVGVETDRFFRLFVDGKKITNCELSAWA